MNKTDLINQIRFETGLSKKDIQNFLKSFKSVIIDALAQEEEVKIRNFGRFAVKERKERKYFNLHTKQLQVIPAKKRATFTFAPLPNKYRIVIPPFEISYKQAYRTPYVPQPFNSNISTAFYSASGQNLIIPYLAIGARREMCKVEETVEFEYWGKVNNGVKKRDSLNKENYPFLLIPKSDTPILACTSFEGIVNGVSEPKLYNILTNIRKIEPEIRVLKSVSLPIKNRNFGYKPDIAIVWKAKGVCIDVEIDEPYDILSRKPIHYTDEDCSDYLRNAYFLENGWYVIRIAEEQVIKNLEDVYNYISHIVYLTSQDERFKANMDVAPVKRWNRSEAMKLAELNFREDYLGLPPHKVVPIDNTDDDGYSIPDSFDFVRPSTDIIDNPYGDITDKLKMTAGEHSYLRIKKADNGYEYVTTKKQITYFFHGIRFYDVVEEKEYYLSYADIDSFVGLDNIKIERENDQKWHYFVYNTIVHCRPIHFVYGKTSENGPTERTVLHLLPYVKYHSGTQKYIESHTGWEWLNGAARGVYKDLCNKDNMPEFSGYCVYRKDVRTFNALRIIEGYAFDCYKPLVNYDTNDVLEVLEKGDGKLAEIIYSHFTEEEKKKYYNIANNGHALAMQGKYDEALKYYFKFPEEMVVSGNLTWRQALWEDIEKFGRNETYGSKIDHVSKLIQVSYVKKI